MSAQPVRRQVKVAIGGNPRPVGDLTFVRDGNREYSAFSYAPQWLNLADCFEISPDLPLGDGMTTRRAPNSAESTFPFALADTEADAWGRRIIQRANVKRRAVDPTLATLTAFDYLASVDDFSRIGALRLVDLDGQFLATGAQFRTPQLLDLGAIAAAARRVEKGNDSAADLEYLQGKATSLGGLRPKCTVIDKNGALAIGKFASVGDQRSIVRAEVLALRLASNAGASAAVARAIAVDQAEVAVIQRFDRAPGGARIPYLSGGSLLQARRDEDRTYTELADAIRRIGAAPGTDLRELFRRLVINLLITNVDDHLWNIGFLYAGDGKWRLAPAFDINPFPDKARESKTWLSENSGPISSLEQLLSEATYFGIARNEAEALAGHIAVKLASWRRVALSREIGLRAEELTELAPAFEHRDAEAARNLAR